jgi:uncharacterized protein
MRIAVVGSGISGLSAAYFLAQRHEVTLFEQDARIGGHTHTVEVPAGTGTQPVDTGWIVYNGVNYPNLTALLTELGVATRPTSMSFGVSLGGGAYEYKGSDRLWTVFAQPENLLSPRHYKFLIDILRLNARCRALLRDGTLPQGSLGDFLDRAGLSPWLAHRYLLPMAGMIWSCSPRKARDYPAAEFLRFFEAHSLFNAIDQPTWRTVVGGSHQYVKKLLASFGGEVRSGAPVREIRRTGCATHSDQALRLVADLAADEREVLGGIPYTRSRCVLHTDESFLPRRRSAWAAWNYVSPSDEAHDRPISGSYWMNLLQDIPGAVNYVVTLNPVEGWGREVPADKIIRTMDYEHPHYTAASVYTQAQLPAIQGRSGLWWAGAWSGYGFHEDGLKSGLRAVQGIDVNCLPPWAKL